MNRSSRPIFTTVLSLILVAFFLLGIIAVALDQHRINIAPKCAICQLKICINGVEDLFTLNALTASEDLYTSEDKIWNTFIFQPPSRVRAPPFSVFT